MFRAESTERRRLSTEPLQHNCHHLLALTLSEIYLARPDPACRTPNPSVPTLSLWLRPPYCITRALHACIGVQDQEQPRSAEACASGKAMATFKCRHSPSPSGNSGIFASLNVFSRALRMTFPLSASTLPSSSIISRAMCSLCSGAQSRRECKVNSRLTAPQEESKQHVPSPCVRRLQSLMECNQVKSAQFMNYYGKIKASEGRTKARGAHLRNPHRRPL